MQRAFFATLIAVFLAACGPDPQDVSAEGGADLILTNARVYTLG